MKNTKMKKFLVVVLSAALVAGLAAGCGSKEDGKEEDKGSSAKTAKVIDVDLTNEAGAGSWTALWQNLQRTATATAR